MFDGDFDGEEDDGAGDESEGNLDEEGVSPAPGVVDPAAEDAAETSPETVADVAEALPYPPSAQGNEIATNEGGDRCHAAASHASYYSAENHDPFFPSKSANQVSDREEDVCPDESIPSGVDICESATERLESGLGDEVG